MKWQPAAVFLPGKYHGQRGLVGYSRWGCKRLGHNLATEQQHIYIERYVISLKYRAFFSRKERFLKLYFLFTDSWIHISNNIQTWFTRDQPSQTRLVWSLGVLVFKNSRGSQCTVGVPNHCSKVLFVSHGKTHSWKKSSGYLVASVKRKKRSIYFLVVWKISD